MFIQKLCLCASQAFSRENAFVHDIGSEEPINGK